MSHPLLHATLSTSSPSLSSTSLVLSSSPNPDLLSTYPIIHCEDPRQVGTFYGMPLLHRAQLLVHLFYGLYTFAERYFDCPTRFRTSVRKVRRMGWVLLESCVDSARNWGLVFFGDDRRTCSAVRFVAPALVTISWTMWLPSSPLTRWQPQGREERFLEAPQAQREKE